jgi:hypothetical protein
MLLPFFPLRAAYRHRSDDAERVNVKNCQQGAKERENMLRNPQPDPEEQAEGQTWQQLMKEAVQQAAQLEAEKRELFTCDDIHHIPARMSAQKNEEQERQPNPATVAKVMKKPQEKKRGGWPGMRFMPQQKKKKGRAKNQTTQ